MPKAGRYGCSLCVRPEVPRGGLLTWLGRLRWGDAPVILASDVCSGAPSWGIVRILHESKWGVDHPSHIANLGCNGW